MTKAEYVLLWSAWARRHAFEVDKHDAAYAGMVEGIPVFVETGVRESGSYDVVVTLPIACGIVPMIVRAGETSDVKHRIVRAAQALVDDLDDLRSVAIHDEDVVLRFKHGVAPDDAVEIGARRIVDAWNTLENTDGAYR